MQVVLSLDIDVAYWKYVATELQPEFCRRGWCSVEGDVRRGWLDLNYSVLAAELVPAANIDRVHMDCVTIGRNDHTHD